ncbi:cell wall-associated hydrolase, partial [Paramagnetospirillum caucaseum]
MTTYTQVVDAVPRVHYAANGVQTAFPFTFPVFDAGDMEVWIDQNLQSAGAYSVSGVGVAVGGTVIFTAPPPPSTRVTLRRRMALKRTAEFPDTAIEAKPLNDALYYQVAALQEVADDAALAVKRSFRSLSSADLTLPEPAAGRAIRWNDSGDGLANSAGDVDAILPLAAAAGATAQAAAGAAAASAAAAGAAELASAAWAAAAAASAAQG